MFVLVFNILGLQSLFGLGFRGFCCCFGDKVCLCSPGWPGTHYLDQGGSKLSNTHLLCLPSTEVKGVCHTPHSFSFSFIKLKWHKLRLTAIQCLPCISYLLFNRATKVSGCRPRLHRSLIAALGGKGLCRDCAGLNCGSRVQTACLICEIQSSSHSSKATGGGEQKGKENMVKKEKRTYTGKYIENTSLYRTPMTKPSSLLWRT